MSTAVLPRAAQRGRSSRAMEGMSWVGVVAGLLLVASASSVPRPAAGPHALYAAMSPDQLVSWAQAICTAIGLFTAAANGAAVAWHRWGKALHGDDPGTPPEATPGKTGGA